VLLRPGRRGIRNERRSVSHVRASCCPPQARPAQYKQSGFHAPPGIHADKNCANDKTCSPRRIPDCLQCWGCPVIARQPAHRGALPRRWRCGKTCLRDWFLHFRNQYVWWVMNAPEPRRTPAAVSTRPVALCGPVGCGWLARRGISTRWLDDKPLHTGPTTACGREAGRTSTVAAEPGQRRQNRCGRSGGCRARAQQSRRSGLKPPGFLLPTLPGVGCAPTPAADDAPPEAYEAFCRGQAGRTASRTTARFSGVPGHPVSDTGPEHGRAVLGAALYATIQVAPSPGVLPYAQYGVSTRVRLLYERSSRPGLPQKELRQGTVRRSGLGT